MIRVIMSESDFTIWQIEAAETDGSARRRKAFSEDADTGIARLGCFRGRLGRDMTGALHDEEQIWRLKVSKRSGQC